MKRYIVESYDDLLEEWYVTAVYTNKSKAVKLLKHIGSAFKIKTRIREVKDDV